MFIGNEIREVQGHLRTIRQAGHPDEGGTLWPWQMHEREGQLTSSRAREEKRPGNAREWGTHFGVWTGNLLSPVQHSQSSCRLPSQ